jgi:hypothetical protein
MKRRILVGVVLAVALALGIAQGHAQQSATPSQGSAPAMMCPMMQQMGGQHMMGQGHMGHGMGGGMMHRCCMMMQAPQETNAQPQAAQTPAPTGN